MIAKRLIKMSRAKSSRYYSTSSITFTYDKQVETPLTLLLLYDYGVEASLE